MFLLFLFYVVAVILVEATNMHRLPGSALVVFLSIPTAGIFALSTERMLSFAYSSEELGIPNYRQILKGTQLVIVMLFVGLPIGTVVAEGGDTGSSVLLVVPAALGTLMVTRRSWLIPAAIALSVVKNAYPPIVSWIAQPWAQAALFTTGIAILVHWFRLPDRTQSRQGVVTARFADSAQDATSKTFADATGAKEKDVENILLAADIKLDSALSGVGPRLTLRSWWFGLGYDPRINVPAIFWTAGLAVVGLGIWQLVQGGHAHNVGYLAFSAYAGLHILIQTEAMSSRYRSTLVEQSLLVLTPKCPPKDVLKLYIVQGLASQFARTWAVWALVTAVTMLVGWMDLQWASSVACALVGATCAGYTCIWIEVLRKSRRGESLINSAVLLVVGFGILLLNIGAASSAQCRWMGLVMIVLPTAIAGILFARGHLQIPTQTSQAAR